MTATAPRPCRTCRKPIRLIQTADGKWRPVEAEPQYMTLAADGPHSGISERTGEFERGTIGPVKAGQAWAIVYRPHLCAAVPVAEKGSVE